LSTAEACRCALVTALFTPGSTACSSLTAWARVATRTRASLSASPSPPANTGYTLAQKMVGRACGMEGVLPGLYCEPIMTTVGSQDTTGPMTRDELKDLACLGFSADLVMQSFCHTAAYPKVLSDVAGNSIDEVFIGSCMTNIGHFRGAGKLLEDYEGDLPTRLWVAPPTKMDEAQLTAEGYYSTFDKVGSRTEMPGCSLCMGNQARVEDNCTVVSTSTRNFPNRLGAGADCYLASAEVTAVCAMLGRIPTPEEYQQYWNKIDANKDDIYQYLNFDQLPEFEAAADTVQLSEEMRDAAKALSAKW